MKIEATPGKPTEDGIYCARQWYGWRILEWWKGEWWHAGKTAKWGNAEIEAYIGPLPVISKDFTKPPLGLEKRGEETQFPDEQEAWEARLDWDGQAMQADDAAAEYDL